MFSDQDRFRVLAIVWGVFAALSALTIITQNAAGAWIILILAGTVLLATAFLTDDKGQRSQNPAPYKRKQSPHEDAAALLADLLDEADLDDIRAHLKTRLLESLERSTDGELSAVQRLVDAENTIDPQRKR